MLRRRFGDPRVARAAYGAAETYGQKLGVLIDGIYAAAPRGNVGRVWEQVPAGHRHLFVLHWAMAELNNGGLHQYYANSTGDMAEQLPAAASYFGASAYADVFARTNTLFAPGALADRERRNIELDAFEDDGRAAQLDALTDAVYDLEDAGDLVYTHMLDHVEARPSEFFRDA